VQSENLFKDHLNSSLSDETKNTYIANRPNGLAKKWGLLLLVDDTLNTQYLKNYYLKTLFLEMIENKNMSW